MTNKLKKIIFLLLFLFLSVSVQSAPFIKMQKGLTEEDFIKEMNSFFDIKSSNYSLRLSSSFKLQNVDAIFVNGIIKVESNKLLLDLKLDVDNAFKTFVDMMMKREVSGVYKVFVDFEEDNFNNIFGKIDTLVYKIKDEETAQLVNDELSNINNIFLYIRNILKDLNLNDPTYYRRTGSNFSRIITSPDRYKVEIYIGASSSSIRVIDIKVDILDKKYAYNEYYPTLNIKLSVYDKEQTRIFIPAF